MIFSNPIFVSGRLLPYTKWRMFPSNITRDLWNNRFKIFSHDRIMILVNDSIIDGTFFRVHMRYFVKQRFPSASLQITCFRSRVWNPIFKVWRFQVRDLKLMIDLRSWNSCRDQEIVISANPVIVITRASFKKIKIFKFF